MTANGGDGRLVEDFLPLDVLKSRWPLASREGPIGK